MNINMTNRNFVFFMNLVIFIVIMSLIYVFVYSKYNNMLNEKKIIYNRFNDINMQLNDFSNIQRSIDEQKDKINEIISEYDDFFIPNDEIVNRYKVQIITLLKQYEIQVADDNVKQIQKDNNIVLSLNLKATYDQVYKFLFDIEKFSTVSNVTISYTGNVTIDCSPVLYSSSINDYFSGRVEQSIDEISAKGYFKEISDKIFASMDVGYIPTWRDLLPVPRNPFISGFVKEKVVKKTVSTSQPVVVREMPTIVLEGIMYETKNPIVIIDGQLYPEGSIYKGAKIIKIDQNSISVNHYGKIYTIKMLN